MQVVDGSSMRLLSRPLGVVDVRWGIDAEAGMIRAVGQCACAEDARGNGGAGVAGRSVPRWRDEAGAGIHSEDVVPFCS